MDRRGLFHDLEHGVTTVSYLIEAVCGDPGLPAEANVRLRRAIRQLSQLRDVLDEWVSEGDSDRAAVDRASGDRPAELVRVRELLDDVAAAAAAEHGVVARVRPGAEANLVISPTLLWRVLSNVVGNAARAAGPGGHVELRVRRRNATIIEVIDDGPGFGNGPPGRAALGLTVVTALLASCGGWLEVRDGPTGGARVGLVFPEPIRLAVSERGEFAAEQELG